MDRVGLRYPALAVAIAGAFLWFGPPASDLAAHVYQRWFFEQHGFALWDNLWYSGRYVFVTYSWLTYPLAAAVGIKPLFTAAVAVAAFAFARLVDHPPAAWAFAVVWGSFAVSGALPFALGVAFALLALLAVSHKPLFGLCAALTWAASPLALLLLLVVLAGLRQWRAAAVAAPLALLQIVLQRLYPDAGHFPFPWHEAAAAAVFCAGGIAFARGRLRGVFVASLALVALSFAFPSQLGENAARLRFVALPLALLVLRGRRPLVLVPLAALAAAYNLSPLYWSFEQGRAERAEHASYWRPAVAWLRTHNPRDYRVHSLDTVGHWEAVYLPQAGIPITRGWYRQDDFPQNALLYRPLTAASYRSWLRDQGVRYVLVPNDRLDYSSKYERRIVAQVGPAVAQAGSVVIYELTDPAPIVPGAHVTRLTHDTITMRVARKGLYRYAIRTDDGGWRKLPATRAGSFAVHLP